MIFFLLQSNENLKKKKISINIQIKLILFLFCSVNKMKQKEKNNWNVISRTTAIGDNHLSIKIFVFAKKISAVISTKDGISKQSSNSSLISCSHFFFFFFCDITKGKVISPSHPNNKNKIFLSGVPMTNEGLKKNYVTPSFDNIKNNYFKFNNKNHNKCHFN